MHHFIVSLLNVFEINNNKISKQKLFMNSKNGH